MPASETGTNVEQLYGTEVPSAVKSSFTAEAVINDAASMGPPPFLRSWLLLPSGSAPRQIKVVCRGVLSSTGQPTFTFAVRLGNSQSTAGPLVGATGALQTVNNASAAVWSFVLDFGVRTLGVAGANTTINGYGMLESPGLVVPVASLFGNPVTVDAAIINYITITAACSASAAGNSLQIGQLLVYRGN